MNSNVIKSVAAVGLLFLFTMTSFPGKSYAWGKRGHETVGSLAARLLADKQKGSEFLSEHSYDLGFYNNVPDIVWKSNPDTFKKESIQHFMDMEHYKDIKKSDWNDKREVFFKKHSVISKKAGRSWWRVQELNQELTAITKSLKPRKIEKSEQHKRQAKWLLHAGVMGHYIADLAQPLHVTDNYDGQKTDQKGIHRWFEEEVVDHLYPNITHLVYDKMLEQWAEFHKKNKTKSVFELCQELTENSQNQIDELLSIDKKTGRKDLPKASNEYKTLAVDRLALGSLYLAEIWSRQTGWNYNGDKFYLFDTKPAYVEPKDF